jgi:hypothetical protein
MKTRAAGDVASGWIRLGGSVRGGCRWGLRGWAGLFLAGLLGAGCASPSTVTTRKQERAAAYAALSAEHQALVDAGRVAVGMGEDAVYMAWGKPAQVLQSGDATGLRTTWLYHGNTTDTYQYWHYYPMPRPGGGYAMARTLQRDIDVREYVSAELVFKDGVLQSFRTLPRPPERSYLAPWP